MPPGASQPMISCVRPAPCSAATIAARVESADLAPEAAL